VLSGNRCCRATVKTLTEALVDGPSILGFEGIRELVLGDSSAVRKRMTVYQRTPRRPRST